MGKKVYKIKRKKINKKRKITKRVLEFTEIICKYGNITKRLILKQSIKAIYYHNDSRLENYYFIENKELNIYSWGKTFNEMIDSFQEYVMFIYECYGLEDNSILGYDAIELKNKILGLVKECVDYEEV